jgi:hypothetical protein
VELQLVRELRVSINLHHAVVFHTRKRKVLDL